MSSFETARKNMVDCQIHTNGVINQGVLNAFGSIPREKFLPANLQNVAYTDTLLQTQDDRFILDPMTHARMVQALDIKKDDVVLVIGCGNGYASAIIAQIATTVIAVESSKKNIDTASKILDEIDTRNVVFIKGKPEQGCKEHAPYSKIFVSGASAEIPSALVDQLATGGLLTFILKEQSNSTIGKITLIHKSDNSYSTRTLYESNAPYLPGFEPKTEFVF